MYKMLKFVPMRPSRSLILSKVIQLTPDYPYFTDIKKNGTDNLENIPMHGYRYKPKHSVRLENQGNKDRV